MRHNFDHSSPQKEIRFLLLTFFDWTIGSIVVSGALLIPSFSLGLIAGVLQFFVSMAAVLTLSCYVPKKEHTNNAYMNFIVDNALHSAIITPVKEELFFRGLLQPLLLFSIASLAPASTNIIVVSDVSLAAVVALLHSAGAFGLFHIKNDHSDAYTQCITTTLSGLHWGGLALSFGLPASIAGHIVLNSLSLYVLTMNVDGKEQEGLSSVVEEDTNAPRRAPMP